MVEDGSKVAAGGDAGSWQNEGAQLFDNLPLIGADEWGGDTAALAAAQAYITTPLANTYAYSAPVDIPAAGADAAALLIGSKWDSIVHPTGTTLVTYSFATSESIYAYPDLGLQATLKPFSEADKATTRAELARIEDVANVQFVEVPDQPDQVGVLRYAYSQKPNDLKLAGLGFYPSADASGGDVWLGLAQSAPKYDALRPELILHETLHALGLKHPFGAGAVLSTQDNIIPNTVMSYSPLPGASSGSMTVYPDQPMPLDIAALQDLYGAAQTNAGDTVYDLAAQQYQAGFRAIWDAGGTDVLDASQLRAAVSIDLNPGARSKIGAMVGAMSTANGFQSVVYTATLAIAPGATIENAIGTRGDDVLTGNGAANRLDGGDGNDTLAGGAGDDTLEGGAGNNTLDGGDGTDQAVYQGSRADYAVSPSGAALMVQGQDGTDTLASVERLLFDDARVALDLGGNAGTAARLIGALLGPHAVDDPHVVAAALGALDRGMTPGALAQVGLDEQLGMGASDGAVVDLLFRNIAAREPTAAEHALYVHLLADGSSTHAGLAIMAANLPANAANIDLVGHAAHGLDYVL